MTRSLMLLVVALAGAIAGMLVERGAWEARMAWFRSTHRRVELTLSGTALGDDTYRSVAWLPHERQEQLQRAADDWQARQVGRTHERMAARTLPGEVG